MVKNNTSITRQTILTTLPMVKKIHFIGILGAGMSGLAEVMSNNGYQVTGSDIKDSADAKRLRELGIVVHIGHNFEHVIDTQVVVVSSAISQDNEELRFAQNHSIPIVPRAHILGELMRNTNSIAVAGSHGKTTTTSLIAHVFTQAGLEPSYVIGGRFMNSHANAKIGSGDYLIAEADESDCSFLHLLPFIAVITNIDNDHLSHYDFSMEKLKDAFVAFVHKLPFYGVAVICADDIHLLDLQKRFQRRVVSYGTHELAHVRLLTINSLDMQSKFTVSVFGQEHTFNLQLPGKHNISNALATIAVATMVGIPLESISNSLATFPGLRRRFQTHPPCKVLNGMVDILEDYAHHPKEIIATLDAAKSAFKNRRLVLVFQPHRFSRTKQLFNDFSIALRNADVLVITETYSASEPYDEAGSGKALFHVIQQSMQDKVHWCPTADDICDFIYTQSKSGDYILIFGAGDINKIIPTLQAKHAH
ncbi:MAG: UDP-N-acetylmuramate--L-alanine ligase [Methylacidiphilales bacterium]|nr:UDP-N-acetylmuramate--L-alanine ligase [Candidatus Methylacidiphilales bacterium]